jgi:cytochrome c oxidase subunit 2
MRAKQLLAAIAAIAGSVCVAPAAWAAPLVPWQIGFQEAASPVMERLDRFHDLLLVIIFAIAIFVMLLLAYVLIRFRRSNNPVPSRTSHNNLLEVAWTVVPIIVLIVITVPSFKLLYYMDRTADAELTLKAIGHQWYWTYEYPDQEITFDAAMVEDADLAPGQLRLLETDNRVVLPVNTTIRLLLTADDVLHAWAIPAFGVKVDTVPGRLNEAWVEVTREGVYYGQCSELCGVNHGLMPITVEVVSKERFAAWVEKAKVKFAMTPRPAARRVASAPGVGTAAKESKQ